MLYIFLPLAGGIAYTDVRLWQMWSSHAGAFPPGLSLAEWLVFLLACMLVRTVDGEKAGLWSIGGLTAFIFVSFICAAGSISYSYMTRGDSHQIHVHDMWAGTVMMGLQLVVFVFLVGMELIRLVRRTS